MEDSTAAVPPPQEGWSGWARECLVPTVAVSRSAPARWTARVLLVLVGVLMALVGLFRIGNPSPWVDESVTVMVVRRAWSGLPPLLGGADAPLVPYYVLAKLWATALFWVPTLTAVRTLSAAAAAVTVAALFALVARRVGWGPALLSALMLISFAGFSRYAQEARPYAMLVMTSTLLWLAWDRWRRPPESVDPARRVVRPGWLGRLRSAGGYLVALIGSVLFHLFGLFQWPAQLLADLTEPGRPGRQRWQRVLGAAGWMVVAAVLIGVPLLLAATRGTGAPRLIPMTPAQLFHDFTVVYTAQNRYPATLVPLVFIAIGLVAVLARAKAAGRYADLARIAVIWVVVPLALSIAAAAIRPALLRSRYWMPIAVPLAVLAAIGLLVLAGWAWRLVQGRGERGARRPALAWLAALLAIVVPLAGYVALAVPAHLSIRGKSGHIQNATPALAAMDIMLAQDPSLPLATSPYTRTTIVWAMRPQLIERDVLQRLDPKAASVWPITRSTSQVAELVKGHDTVLWMRAIIETTGTPKPTVPPKAFQELGFTVMSAERSGSWWVCLLQRQS